MTRKTKPKAPPAAPRPPVTVTADDARAYVVMLVQSDVDRIIATAARDAVHLQHSVKRLADAAAAGDLLGILMAAKELAAVTELGHEARVLHQLHPLLALAKSSSPAAALAAVKASMP